MERIVGIVCAIVSIIGLSCVILAFAAESKRVKIEDVRLFNGKCLYPERPALGLGLTSALLLLVYQILISSFAGCICCKKTKISHLSFCIGVICYVVSWVTFCVAFLFLIPAAALNGSNIEDVVNVSECRIIKPGVFAGCAVLCFVTLVLGIIYYLISSTVRPSEARASNQEIAMGQPQMNTPPMFVHEDTYRRQQYP